MAASQAAVVSEPQLALGLWEGLGEGPAELRSPWKVLKHRCLPRGLSPLFP